MSLSICGRPPRFQANNVFYSTWKLEKSIREIARVVFVHAESLLTNHPRVDCGVSGVNIIHKELGEKYLIALGW